ncbi:MAG: hypothetical protein V7K90_25565 [Nostoc sp.]|uniref:hypothetical protein n=1 Tax=Nostoc sp. TaxID=1180 RepID=UPI002FF6AD19
MNNLILKGRLETASIADSSCVTKQPVVDIAHLKRIKFKSVSLRYCICCITRHRLKTYG